MSVEVIAKIVQKNGGTFPLMDAANVDYDGTGEKSIKEKIDDHASQLADNASELALKAPISYVDTKVDAMATGTPKIVVQSIVDLPVIGGVEKLALVLDDGHKYYDNGVAWTDAGVYQGTLPSDGSVSKTSFDADLQSTIFEDISSPQDYVYKKTYNTLATHNQFSATMVGFSAVINAPDKLITKISGSFKAGAECTLVCNVHRTNINYALLASVEMPYTPASPVDFHDIDFLFDNLDVSAETVISVSIFVKDNLTWLTYADMSANTSTLSASGVGNYNRYRNTAGAWVLLTADTHLKFCLLFDIYAERQVPNLNNVLASLPSKMNYIYVSPSYNTTDVGFGVTKFSSIWLANSYISDNSVNKQYTIIVKQGTYTDLQVRYAGITGTYYQGVTCKDYVYYESEDINRPDLCIIEWDGATGFTTPTTADVINKSPFHVIGSATHGTHTHVKGFTFNVSNLRYGYHVETQSFGIDVDWLFENCVINWGGRVGVSDNSGVTPVIGMGSSPFEKGKIRRCVLNNTEVGNTAGIQNHDNVFGASYGYTPFMVDGATIEIEDCDLNGLDVEFRTGYVDVYDTFNVVELKNCVNVNHAYLGFINGVTTQKWKAIVGACDITTNEM